MRIVTWNVNSVRMRLSQLVGWLERHRPDALCLQETKIPDDGFPRLEIEATARRLGFQESPRVDFAV